MNTLCKGWRENRMIGEHVRHDWQSKNEKAGRFRSLKIFASSIVSHGAAQDSHGGLHEMALYEVYIVLEGAGHAPVRYGLCNFR